MLAVFKSLAKLWVILGLVFILLYCSIPLLLKIWESIPVYPKVNGVDIDPRTYACVSELALIDGGCHERKNIDCETLIKSYEASCFPPDSEQTKEMEQRLREWEKTSKGDE